MADPITVWCNNTHSFGSTFNDDIAQDDIARCPRLEGIAPDDVLADVRVPESIRRVVALLPWGWGGARRYRWLYVRPQRCELGQADSRSGAFWHIDVDAVGRCVAPNWDDFRAMAVSFGDVAETEFIIEQFSIHPDGPPKSADYVTFSPIVNNGRQWLTEAPQPRQIAHYTVRDFHRAGPIRRSGWRLVILAFETDAPPVERWPK